VEPSHSVNRFGVGCAGLLSSTHILTGVLVGLLLGQDSQPLETIAMAGAAGIGALLPDIDHPYSIVGRRSGLAGGALRLAVGHRGALHSGLVAAIMFGAALAISGQYQSLALASAAGYASHIVLDALTIQGVPLLWPSRRRFRLLALRTGGMVERVIFIVLILILGWMVLA